MNDWITQRPPTNPMSNDHGRPRRRASRMEEPFDGGGRLEVNRRCRAATPRRCRAERMQSLKRGRPQPDSGRVAWLRQPAHESEGVPRTNMYDIPLSRADLDLTLWRAQSSTFG
ncbi:hypothetical protein J6590_023887 [Homalodisca vitripennis]|nr:hypothetical protein J6590_023887 [Homalodisca vitripennis]